LMGGGGRHVERDVLPTVCISGSANAFPPNSGSGHPRLLGLVLALLAVICPALVSGCLTSF
jgi:hypothetical protein